MSNIIIHVFNNLTIRILKKKIESCNLQIHVSLFTCVSGILWSDKGDNLLQGRLKG